MRKAVMLMANEQVMFALINMVLQLKTHEYIDGIILVVDIKNSKEKWHDFFLRLDERIEVIFFADMEISRYLKFDVKSSKFVNKYGLMPFSRFLLFDWLKKYDSIAMMDIDLLITGRFEEIFEKQGCMAWHPVPNNMMERVVKEAKGATYPRGGTIVINKKIKDFCTSPIDECFFFLNQIINVDHCDELVFGILAFKYKMPISLLEKKYNSYPTEVEGRGAVVIHGLSDFKFWRHPVSRVMFREWEVYNRDVDALLKEEGLEDFSCKLPGAMYNERDIYNAVDLVELYQMLGGIVNELNSMQFDVKAGVIRIYPFEDKEIAFFVYKKMFSHLICICFMDKKSARAVSELHRSFFSMMCDFWKERIKISFDNNCSMAVIECLRGEVSSFINRFYYNLNPYVNEYIKAVPDMTIMEGAFYRNKMSRIRTFHNTWLILEGDKFLVHTKLHDRNMAQLVYAAPISSEEIFLFVVGIKGIVYVKEIYADGSVILSKEPSKHKILAGKDDRYIIIINKENSKKLSARDNSMVSWVDNNLDWEHFILECN